jgi:hypothetical protein
MFLSYRLTGNHYWDFLLHVLPKLPEDVPLAFRARMWYMHVDAPAHLSRAVRDVLSNTYHDRWIGTGGLNAWPPRSPDLNHLDFYLWGHLNTLVSAAPVDNEGALQIRTVDACQNISNYPGIFDRMRLPWWDVSRRAFSLMENILGSYYKCTLSAITNKLNVSATCSYGHSFLFLYVEFVPKICQHISVTTCTYLLRYFISQASFI